MQNLVSLNGSILPVKRVTNLFLKIAKQLLIKSPFSSELVGFGTP